MAIKIQTEKPVIPIEIGDLRFEFDISDEAIKAYRKNSVKVQKELADIKVEKDGDKALEQAKDVLQRGYEITLGKGSFEKIYELSPSVRIAMKYFAQITEGIEQKLNEMGLSLSQKEKAKKYLAQKKK